MQDMRKLAGVALLAATSIFLQGESRASSRPAESMALSCEEKPFLSASVSTPTRDALSPVQIKLVDPDGHQQGDKIRGVRIPDSHYKAIIQIPSYPIPSLAQAIEICGATPGKYELTIYEHSNDPYRIAVRAEQGVKEDYVVTLQLKAKEAHTRHFRFLFKVSGGQASVVWLDNKGQQQLGITPSEW